MMGRTVREEGGAAEGEGRKRENGAGWVGRDETNAELLLPTTFVL
jgi:hypothetical protein